MFMCKSDHRWKTSAWCLMEAVSGQAGITASCIQHIIQVMKRTQARIVIMVTEFIK